MFAEEVGMKFINHFNTFLYYFFLAKRDSQLFFEIINWYDKRKNLEWNSRTIRELCHSLQITKFGLDSACDQFFEYIIKNKDIVMGETVEKVKIHFYF